MDSDKPVTGSDFFNSLGRREFVTKAALTGAALVVGASAWAGSFPRMFPENMTANMPVVDILRNVATAKGGTPAQVAIAWLLAQKSWIVPIPGTRRVDHLTENLGALNIQLTRDDLLAMEQQFSQLTVHGERMSEMHMQQIDRN